MLNYTLDISNKSSWIRSTPNETIKSLPFTCSEAGEFFARKHFFTQRDYKDCYWLVFTVSGTGYLTQNNSTIKLTKGSCALINCREKQRYGTDSSCECWHHYWVHIDGFGVESLLNLIEQPLIFSQNISEVSAFFLDILAHSKQNTTADSLYVSLAIHQILQQLVKSQLVSQVELSSRHDEMIEVAHYLRKNYQKPLQIDVLAQKAHLSKYYFIRVFRQYLGTTPYDYLLHFRINKAKELLCTTNWSSGRIGLYVGFGSESNFTAQFTRIVSLSPVKYRKETYLMNQDNLNL